MEVDVMLAVAVASNSRGRAFETGFIVERYHRAFDDEVAHIRTCIHHAPGDLNELAPAFDMLAEHLRVHEAFQERDLFPMFERGASCLNGLGDAWARDAFRLVCTLERFRGACGSLDPRRPLVARVAHLAHEVHDHLAAEARVLAAWRDAAN